MVDDDAIVRMDLEAYLRSIGHDVVASCATGEEAIEIASNHHLDLVLMDIILPGEMDGVDAARLIRLESRVPVIYLSGYCDEIAVARAKLTEPYGYLLKPYDKRTLRTTVETALKKRHAEQERKKETSMLLNFASAPGT